MVLHRSTLSNSKRKDVFIDHGISGHKGVLSNTYKLINGRDATDCDAIFNSHMPRKLDKISENIIASNHTIMTHMAVSHHEIIVANDSFSVTGHSSNTDCDAFTKDVAVADDEFCFLAFVF